MSALAGLATLALAASAAEQRVRFVELVLEGPLAAAVVGEPDGRGEASGTARVAGPLGAGERRTLVVPVPVPATLAPERAPLPAVRLEGAGPGAAARVVRALEPQPVARLAALSAGLRARPWPVPAAALVRPAPAALLALALALFVSLALRRRPVRLALASLAGALAAVLLQGRGAAGAPEARVLEVDLAAGRALEARGARDAIALGFDELLLEPPDAPLAVRCDLEGRGEARAPGALLVARRALEARAEPARWGSLAAAWVRGADGAWGFRGAWPAGAALPAERSGPPVPAWLAAGVPPGVGVLVGERALEAGWVRAVGFRDEAEGGARH